MTSGCICCTLSADLVSTLQQLDQDYDVDLVIVEPSDAAEPGNILNALPYYKGRPLGGIRSIALLDPLRITELYAVLTPLITKQIEKADRVILTKADLASSEEIDDAKTIAQEIIHPGRCMFFPSISRFLETLARESTDEEDTVIGHIKALAKLPGNGFIQTSVASASRPATGEIVDAARGSYDELTLTLNFLVYGLPFEKARSIVEQSAGSIMKENGGSIQIRNISDPSHHSHHHDA